MAPSFLLAQLSDLHVTAAGRLIFGRVDTGDMVRACVNRLLALERRPDAVIVTGDLTDLGLPEEYARLRELLAPLSMPVYLVPGNHDRRDSLRTAFPEHGYLKQLPEFVQYAIEAHPLRIVALDTLVPGESGGALCEERLEWLERTLAQAPGRPTVVLMHHPPFRTFIERIDGSILRDPEAFAVVIRRHPQVEAVLCGHIHRPIEVRFAGTVASTAPSVVHQVALDLHAGDPLRFVMEPPAYRLHAYAHGMALVSHTAYVDEFDGPYPFSKI